jgi:SAM-dependent methyltransferase
MCDQACIEFGIKHIRKDMVYGKSVIEVGSLDVNGSVRHDVMRFDPSSYIGIDIMPGPGVDAICDISTKKEVAKEEYDMVISTEALEHIEDWRQAINNMKDMLKVGGYILITTRSPGFSRHNHPYDFWRFTEADMIKIFSEYDIVAIESDIYAPGIFIFAKKIRPEKFDLSTITVGGVC